MEYLCHHKQREVTRIDKLSNVERTTIAKLLARVRRDCFRTIQISNDRDVHLMEPSCFQEVLPTDAKYKGIGIRTVTWICLPYFSLEPYSGLESGAGSPSGVPVQTLLQSQQSHVGKHRDMKQAVCRDGYNRRQEMCLHVAQLWCIVLDNCKFFCDTRKFT